MQRSVQGILPAQQSAAAVISTTASTKYAAVAAAAIAVATAPRGSVTGLTSTTG